ncbi:MAG: UDP-N-acetylmuramoyl-L-alanyl-D-glutamate--2,6-diaminopimelate ligase, partial [Desulfoprunum sp.]|nr:UDP-N-acetylmuramoyl-L-alanyl-D-glutamate--2,6-diaminopimelate ligase [Desulfoprunum sp.]
VGISYRIVGFKAGSAEDLPEISAISTDSRQILNGGLFVAISGSRQDGHSFIDEAVMRGCAAVMIESGRIEAEKMGRWDICLIEVTDSRTAYAQLAASFYGHPADSLKLIGITGTNGKTTITYLLEEVLVGLGEPVGVIGTVNYRYTVAGKTIVLPSPNTTPEAMQLQGLLRTMVDAGVCYVIMEISSHALSQSRIGNIHFDVAAFTNLTRDHLDYHEGMDDYFQAKTKLFTEHLKEGGVAVVTDSGRIPGETDWGGELVKICRTNGIAVLTCGEQPDADFCLVDYVSDLHHSEISLKTVAERFAFNSGLVGRFNVDNIMTSLVICSALKYQVAEILPYLAKAGGAPGRLQRIVVDDGGSEQKPVVFVDYAHTPDALQKVLQTLAALPHRELFCLFGCGGDRDPGKRPVMGRIAAEISDVVVLADDNPRSELPETIMNQIAVGVAEAGMPSRSADWLFSRKMADRGCVQFGRREEAIATVIRAAGSGDIILIAGKGHETYQLIRGRKRFFDDCLEAREALSAWTLGSILQATGGRRPETSPGGLLGRVSTDSRNVARGEVFVALEGERFDGHDFIAQVAQRGAGCLIVAREIEDRYAGGVPQIIVPDTLRAFGDMARGRRRMMRHLSSPVVIGITGSCGKTTVKEMTAAILARRWPAGPDYPENCVLKTTGNFNNLIGMPLSLLPLGVKHKAAVMEMGMNRPGELARLAEIAEPDVSCITNIHAAHLEGLHSLEGVARAKEELFAGTSSTGILVINLDDPLVRACAEKYPQKKIGFSSGGEGMRYSPNIWASDVQVGAEGLITFIMHLHQEMADIHLYAAGIHNVANALAAAAIASSVGAQPLEIAAGLSDFRAAAKRMEILEGLGGYGILNDTYNANPASMAAGLITLQQMRAKTSVALLGDMLELGESTEAAHRELGRLTVECGIDFLGLVGEFAGITAQGAIAAGMPTDRVRIFKDKETACLWLEGLQAEGRLKKGDWLLVKASRGLKMETIIERLTGKT